MYVEKCVEDFGIIEKAKKKTPYVFVPDDWINTFQLSSKNFCITKMLTEDFISVANMDVVTKNTKKDSEKNPIRWREIRWLWVQKDRPTEMQFKESLTEDLIPFKMADWSSSFVGRPPTIRLDPMYDQPLEIKAAKWENLQELLELIPPVHHQFYRNMRHTLF